jgi:hypothetical protein
MAKQAQFQRGAFQIDEVDLSSAYPYLVVLIALCASPTEEETDNWSQEGPRRSRILS